MHDAKFMGKQTQEGIKIMVVLNSKVDESL